MPTTSSHIISTVYTRLAANTFGNIHYLGCSDTSVVATCLLADCDQAGCQYMFDEWSDLFQEALQLPLPVVHRAVQWYGQDSVGGQQSAPPTELLESLADLKVDTKLRDKIVEAFTEQGISPQTAAHPTDVVHVAYKEVLRGALVLDMAGQPSLRDSLPSQQPQDNAVLPGV